MSDVARKDCAASPERAPAFSMSNKVAELILASCLKHDPSAHISSVLRDGEGRTVVRVRADPQNNPIVLLRALQKLWPLAKCSVQENALDGTVEAEIVVPRERDEHERAKKRARKSLASEVLLVFAIVTMAIALAMYVNDCVVALTNVNATISPRQESEGEL